MGLLDSLLKTDGKFDTPFCRTMLKPFFFGVCDLFSLAFVNGFGHKTFYAIWRAGR